MSASPGVFFFLKHWHRFFRRLGGIVSDGEKCPIQKISLYYRRWWIWGGEVLEAGYIDIIHFNFILNIIFIVPRIRSKDCCKEKNRRHSVEEIKR